MFKYIFWYWIIFGHAFGQSVTITEIAPHTLGEQPEWFEFMAEGYNQSDLLGWQINNSGANKLLENYADTLFEGSEEGYWYFSPSPVGLTNSGGSINLLSNTGESLATAIFGASKSRSTKDFEEREVWNYEPLYQQFLPQLIRQPLQGYFSDTQGRANRHLPTPPSQYRALINEVSVKNQTTDFIEIKIVDGPEKINLQYLSLKHNGTLLWHFEAPYWVHQGDLLIFKVNEDLAVTEQGLVFNTNAKAGLSGGSGTIELTALSGTSLEQNLDFTCWQNEQLSQSESARVDKFIETQAWSGPCIEISDLISNESIARHASNADTHTAADWWRHFNGSAQLKNTPKNHKPTAIIEVQGSNKITGPVPFFLNLSAELTTDPDGTHDLRSWEWQLNSEVISDKANPAGFYIQEPGTHLISLTVTDFSGDFDTNTLNISVYEAGKDSTSNGETKKQKEKFKAQIERLNNTQNTPEITQWIAFANEEQWLAEKQKPELTHPLYPNYETPKPERGKPPLYDANWKRKINLPKPVRARTAKNLGTLFSWRESAWPGLAAEWTAVVEHDQTFGHFGGVYLGF